MLGIILLLIAIVCYFHHKTRWLSYILYIGFLSQGYVVLTDSVLGFKNMDLAIIYTFVICFYLLITHQFKIPKIPPFRWFRVFIAFLICSLFFSFLYYNFTPFQILQGSRNWLLLFSLPILIRMSYEDFIRVIKVLAYITLITSILYIAQTVLGKPILPYENKFKMDSATGLIRLYNFPPFLAFFLILIFVNSNIFKGIYFWRIILIIALLCTLGRAMIFAVILTILIALWMQGKASKFIKIGVVLLIIILPFASMISDRFEQGNTGNDLQNVMQGGYEDFSSGSSNQTMTFRFALLYERVNYLAHRPILEQIFGMGFISESQPIVHRMYHFNIGLRDQETGRVSQLRSPDIAWVNTVCGLGFVGTAIYLVFFLSLGIYLYRHRYINPYYTAIAAFVAYSLISSFAGSGISECRGLAIYFIVMSTGFVFNKRKMGSPHFETVAESQLVDDNKSTTNEDN